MNPGRMNPGRTALTIGAGVGLVRVSSAEPVWSAPPGAVTPVQSEGSVQPGLVGRTQLPLPEEGWPSGMADRRVQANGKTPASVQAGRGGGFLWAWGGSQLGTGQPRGGDRSSLPHSVGTLTGLFPLVRATTLLKKYPTFVMC